MQGDREAFAVLFSEHYGAALGFAQSLLRDHHRAQDAVQEAFLVAHGKLASLQRPEAFGAWLRAIVFRRCQRVLRAHDLRLVPDLTPPSHARPDDAAADLEEREWLRELVAALPPEDRQVAALFYFSACSQREVGAFLGIPVTTVNNRLHRARQRMKAWRSETVKTVHSPEENRVGTIQAVRGPLVEVRFGAAAQIDVLDALAVADPEGNAVEGLKVAQRLGGGTVRCLITRPEVPLEPGLKVLNTGQLGVGRAPGAQPVHAVSAEDVALAARSFAKERSSPPVLVETGVKALDVFCPLPAGGVVANTGIPGVGRLVLLEELIRRSEPGWDLTALGLVERSDPACMRGVLEPGLDYSGERTPNVELLWVLTEGANDPAAPTRDAFDAIFHCSPLLAVHGLYPAVDPLRSSSSLLRAEVVGEEHVETVRAARELLSAARKLTFDPELLELLACRSPAAARRRARRDPSARLATLSKEDRLTASRARRLQCYLTQPFFVAEELTGIRGNVVRREVAVRDVAGILAGRADDLPAEALLYGSDLADARARHAAGEPPRNPFGG